MTNPVSFLEDRTAGAKTSHMHIFHKCTNFEDTVDIFPGQSFLFVLHSSNLHVVFNFLLLNSFTLENIQTQLLFIANVSQR